MYKYFLGVRLDKLTRRMAGKKIQVFLDGNSQYKIYTPNPEMLVKAHGDKGFREILNKADLNICDGKGISICSFGAMQSIPGVDFMLDICKIIEKKDVKVFLLGSDDAKVVRKTALNLTKVFPKLAISDFHEGPQVIENKDGSLWVEETVNNLVLERIRRSKADVLFVAFGHGKQEKWIERYLKELPNVKIVMGVGGAFDFISGSVERAPEIMQSFGLEWLWRLKNNPKRWKRIWNAVIVFPYLYITQFNENYDKN
ncbi:MAG: WecB/TagA/CpsF family glycosyltransferase [Candidatus Magasanikbacteria bacterium]|nr:WecB/TagA/CpsF family glycosyltransferase [Candidatus Magasanikbacteria bacterium]